MDAWLAMMRQVQELATGGAGDASVGEADPSLIAALIQRGLATVAAEGEALAAGDDPEAVAERLLPRLQETMDELLALHRNASEAALLPVELASAALGHLAALQSLHPLGSEATAGAAPRLGMFQSYQAQLEAVACAAQRYRDATRRYGELLAQVGNQSIAEFDRRLRLRDGQTPTGVRELHGLWVAAGEAAYEEVLRSDAYSEAFGELTNAAVELSSSLQGLWDEVLEALSLPSRRELEATQQRLEQVRRRSEAETRELRREMERLRRELRGLTTAPGARHHGGGSR